MFKETIIMAFKNLKSNTMRTVLSILGVLIGIASIIALMTLGQGVTSSVTDQLSGLGGNKISISIRNTTVKSGFNDTDLETFSEIPSVTAVSPQLNSYAAVVTEDSPKATVSGGAAMTVRLSGISQHFIGGDQSIKLRYGRGLTSLDIEQKSYYCILGSSVSEELFGNYDPRGETIYVSNIPFVVIDVLEKINGSASGFNNSIAAPYTTVRDVMGAGEVTSIELFVADSGSVGNVYDSAQQMLLDMFNYNSKHFRIENQKLIMDMVVTITDLIVGMLGGIAAIALLVGGIGIMNIMLVSVRERTNEIGLRLALGAKPSYIMLQFLIEAVIISLLGGLLGIVVGIVIAYVACQLIGAIFSVSASTILLSVGFSAAIGILFGILPARKASKLDPIEALRSS